MKGSESVDTHKKDKLPPFGNERADIFKIRSPKEKRFHQIHRANLNEMNDESLGQIEKELINQKRLLAEKKRARVRKNNGVPGHSQSEKQLVHEGMEASPLIGKRAKSFPSYAIHYLNEEALIEDNVIIKRDLMQRKRSKPEHHQF